ncbi:MFS transporter [Pseudodesulfovibrio sediminis]|uniref:Major facilitator superfamily (MFS) profile domain-containing protein n=1 Tax=Pseudodesulfovibrio sediminis TaxID=2810563 RepID=A0ABM7P311_9BACT|nr:MFS transporter [Pseudodesulfovibrio sediminis]BCS88056.1 hypothetical protein PSDVSF_12980 [Pseudodesulfovibrio sediminis]
MSNKKRTENTTPSPLNFLLLCGTVFLIVCNVAVYFSLHVYLQRIGFSGSQSGLVISLYSLAGMILYGTMSSRITPSNAFLSMTIGLIAMFLGGCGYLFTTSLWGLLGLRIVQGIGGFCVFAPCTVLLVSIIPKGKEGSAFSLYSAALLLPYSILPIVSDGLSTLVSSPTWLYAGAASLMLPAAAFTLWLKGNIHLSLDGKSSKKRLGTRDSFANLKQPTILAVLVTNLFYFIIFTGIFFLFQGFALSRGIENAGIFFTIQTGVMIAIRLGANRIFDTLSPKLLITTAMVLTSASLGCLVLLNGSTLLILLAILFGLGMGLCTPPLNALLYQSGDPQFRGFNANMMILTIHAGSFLGPLLGSRMVEITGYTTFLLASALTTLGVGILFMLLAPIPRGHSTRPR